MLAEPFLSLPSKRELPDYYVTVTDPISLNMIKRKLREGEYSTLQDLVDDLDKMFDNCKLYNRPDSRLYKEAVKLQKVVTNVMEELESGDEDNGVAEAASPVPEEVKKSPKDTLRGRLKILYDSILYWANSDNIQPIGLFMEKPKKTECPDYYEIISQPIVPVKHLSNPNMWLWRDGLKLKTPAGYFQLAKIPTSPSPATQVCLTK